MEDQETQLSQPTLWTILKDGVQILAWLNLLSAVPAFCVSHGLRQLLTALVAAHITFDVWSDLDAAGDGWGDAEAEAKESRRRSQQTLARLPSSLACGPLHMYLRISLKEMPVRRDSINRGLQRLIPCISWVDCPHVRLNCRNNVDLVHVETYKIVGSLYNHDAQLMLSGLETFRHVTRLTLTVLQIACLGPEVEFPQVRRLKLLCRDSHHQTEAMERLPKVFPMLERLHLEAVPAALLSVCGNTLKAPQDLRLTLSEDFKERQEGIFVASHLLTMPFTWAGSFFRGVARLQMNEMTEEHGGLSLEQLSGLMRSMPQLRRLGTVNMKVVQLIDILREGSMLEELVLVLDLQEVPGLFRSMVVLEQLKRRLSLVRLAIHLLATDGAPQPPLNVEKATVCAWFSLVATCLREGGFVTFSVAQPEILETAPLQLPWLQPMMFGLDSVDYTGGRLPLSTALSRTLPFHSVETVPRPRGTLIAGPLRPALQSDGQTAAGVATPIAAPGYSLGYGLIVEGSRAESKERSLSREPTSGKLRADSKGPTSNEAESHTRPVAASTASIRAISSKRLTVHERGRRGAVKEISSGYLSEMCLSKAVEVLLLDDY